LGSDCDDSNALIHSGCSSSSGSSSGGSVSFTAALKVQEERENESAKNAMIENSEKTEDNSTDAKMKQAHKSQKRI